MGAKSLPYSGRMHGIGRRVRDASVVSDHEDEAGVQVKVCLMTMSERY